MSATDGSWTMVAGIGDARRASPKLKLAVPGTKPSGAEHKTVLVVEDNDLNRKLFHDLLETRGYNIIETAEGMEALALAEVSGIEVIKWLKENDELKSIPVIAVTAFAMKGDDKRILAAGCEAYMAKPITVKVFLETVARLLSHGPAASPRD